MKKTLLLLVFVLAAAQCFALSVSPGKQLFAAPGTHEFQITVHPGSETGLLHVYASGDLATAITFDNYTDLLRKETVVTGRITIPENVTPGDHEQRIVVSFATLEEGVIAANTEVVSLLVVRKEFDGPYLVLSASPSRDSSSSDSATLYMTLQNRGSKPVTPSVKILRGDKDETLTAQEVPAKGAITLTKILHGHGEEQVTILIEGANIIKEELAIIIGRPIITHLSAEVVPEEGNIHPLTIKATIDWNRPVDAKLLLGQKETTIMINGSLQETFYAETAQNNITVQLRVGEEQQSIIVDLTRTSPASQVSRALSWWPWIVVCAVLVIIGAMLLAKYRPKQE